jgi:ATP-binding cassette subfamily B multidrug efflux pump
VDPSHQAQIYDNIWKKYAHQTCLFVSDYMPVHQRADLILVLHQGHIVEAGTYAELVQAGGLYARMYQPDVSHFKTEPTKETSPV